MRQSLFFWIITLLLAAGCQSANYEKQIQDLKEENARQVSKNQAQQEYIEKITSSVVDIQRNLNRIQLRQEKIAKVSSDIEKSAQRSDSTLKENILKNISDIDTYLLENQKALSALESDLKNADFKIESLENLVAELRFSVLQREKQIMILKEEVRNLNVQISALQNTVDVLDDVILQQEEELAKAYYVIGSESELEQKNIIEVKGGLLGVIGRTVVASDSFNPESFIEINTISTDTIPIPAALDDISLVSLHEKKSYTLKALLNDRSLLMIKNPYSFWLKSKFLIITISE
jgi:hypothetical protein